MSQDLAEQQDNIINSMSEIILLQRRTDDFTTNLWDEDSLQTRYPTWIILIDVISETQLTIAIVAPSVNLQKYAKH